MKPPDEGLSCLLLVVVLLTLLAHAQRSVIMDGDLILGGLFPVHEKGEGTPCSEKLYNRGLQRLEAMLFAVDQINADPHILPHASIGVNILDTCSTDTYALNQSLEFIRASLDVLDTVSYECTDGSLPRLRYRSKAVSGVIGGSYSTISINAANLFRLFRIPQVSPASTAAVLSDKSRFEFFARTVPPDTFQATALVDIVQLFNWSYVSTIASEGSYGESGIDAFHRQASERNICVAVAEKVPRDAGAKTFEAIVRSLQRKPMARGVVLFVRAEDARGVLAAARRLRLQQPFYWIASDGWGKQESILSGVEEVAEGAITVELTSKHFPAFDAYMAGLTPQNNRRNPWFAEYWELFFNCRLQARDGANATCDPDLRLVPEAGFVQESKVQFVIDAVWAFALALQQLQLRVCGSNLLVCKEMKKFDGGKFYKEYILNVSFYDQAGSKVTFDERGDGMARYTIFNYQRTPDGAHKYKVIGRWSKESEPRLNMNASDVQWNVFVPDGPPPAAPSRAPDLLAGDLNATEPADLAFTTETAEVELAGKPVVTVAKRLNTDPVLDVLEAATAQTVPLSVCALPCKVGEVKRMQQGDTCCWICDRCEPYEYMADEHTCADCGPGRWPHEDKQSCFDLEIQHSSDAGGDGAVPAPRRHADREGVGSRAQLHAAGRHPHLLHQHLPAADQAQRRRLRAAAHRRRTRLRLHLQRPLHQDQPDLAHLRVGDAVSEAAELHQSQVADCDRDAADQCAAAGHGRLAAGGTPGHQVRLPGPPPGDPQVSHQGLVFPGVAGVQHGADRGLHGVRCKGAQGARELQRDQVHRLHHVHDVYHLVGLRAHLLRHRKLVRGADHHAVCGDQSVSVGGSHLPVRAQGVHHRLPPGEERAETDDEQLRGLQQARGHQLHGALGQLHARADLGRRREAAGVRGDQQLAGHRH